MSKLARLCLALALAALLLPLAACTYSRSHRQHASVVDYLYPEKDSPVVKEEMAVLKVPLSVGILFVPSAGYGHTLSEPEKASLAERIAAEFRQEKFVKEIVFIPSAYVKNKGGFDNLSQVASMHGTDVVTLLSYDQIQHTDQGLLSFTYWTLIGAYLVKGEKNDTSTMMDAAVYHVPSRKLLFRAPGLSTVKGSATPINLSEELRSDSRKGFALASDELVTNLKSSLAGFREKIKAQPESFKVVDRYTGGGGGAVDPVFAGGALLLLASGLFFRRSNSRR